MEPTVPVPSQFFYAVYVAAYGVVGVLLFLSVIVTWTFFITRKTHSLVNSELAEWKRAVMQAGELFAASERRAGVREGQRDAEQSNAVK